MKDILTGLGPDPLFTGATPGDPLADGEMQPLHDDVVYLLLHAEWSEDTGECSRAACGSRTSSSPPTGTACTNEASGYAVGTRCGTTTGVESRFHPRGSGDCQAGYLFNADASEYLFTGPTGTPASLNVDEEALGQQIHEPAAELGLTIDRLQLAGILVTTELEVTSEDPEPLLKDTGAPLSTLIDPRSEAGLEGLFFVRHDSDGGGEVRLGRSIGVQSGLCGATEDFSVKYTCGHWPPRRRGSAGQ